MPAWWPHVRCWGKNGSVRRNVRATRLTGNGHEMKASNAPSLDASLHFAAFSRLGHGIRGSALFSTGQTIAQRPPGDSARLARAVSHRVANKVCSHSTEAQSARNGRQDFVKCEMADMRSRACSLGWTELMWKFGRIKTRYPQSEAHLPPMSNQWRRPCRKQLLPSSARC